MSVSCAIPSLPVTVVLTLSVPPLSGIQLTVTPATALPYASTAFTTNGCADEPAATTCASPLTLTSATTAPAFAVADSTTGVRPLTDAISESVPATVPRVQLT